MNMPYPQQYAPPAQPQYPGYPPQQAPQQFAQQPGYPAQGFPQAPQQQPAQPLAQGTIDDFYNQPSSGGGASLKFEQPGTRYVGVVARAVGNGDIQQQTNTQNVPQFFKDGRPKLVMRVPLSNLQSNVQLPSQDGLGQWYVKGQARDELARAMAEAGCQGAPEAGAVIDITFTGTRPSGPGMNPAKVFQVVYAPPAGSTAGSNTGGGQQAPQQAPAAQPEQGQQPQAAPLGQVPGTPSPVPGAFPQAQQGPQQAPLGQPGQQLGAPQGQPGALIGQGAEPQQQFAQQPQAPQGQPQPPAGLTPEQQALMARITGGGQQGQG